MRRKTTEVKIGNIILSATHPVMVQSMLNTRTMDTDACVEQSLRIVEAGGELVRITAQGVKEAENLQNIKAKLKARGCDVPLSADIHFNREAALTAARYVEKVRINPGNFVDKRATFREAIYTDEEYAAELTRLREKFTEFLDVCQQHGTAVRIGTNHGSLSDRIMNRYGNTPAGMVEATMEYLRICRDTQFDNVVISLKSSDCRVMVDAVRLLVEQMEREQMAYPLHLGVTEAGEGEDGRIRSAIGIGTLLNEGIGDTIRVSLTESPEAEIPVARRLSELCRPEFNAGAHRKGNRRKPVVVADIAHEELIDERVSACLGFTVDCVNDPVYGDMLKAGETAPEMIYTEALGPELTKLPTETIVIVASENLDMAHVYNRNASPLLNVGQYMSAAEYDDVRQIFVEIEKEPTPAFIQKVAADARAIIVLAPETDYHAYRNLLFRLRNGGVENRIIIRVSGDDALKIAAHTGGLFLDQLVDGLWIGGSAGLDLSRSILQSAGARRYRTEFVSCPGCGRTMYDLQGAVAKVKKAFAHLSHLKIAIMGCVVNGPGEMGDADYGYVGAGNGKVNLYKGKEMVRVAVPEEDAVEELRKLIEQS